MDKKSLTEADIRTKLFAPARVAIERHNPCLKALLPEDDVQLGFDKQLLGELIEITVASEGRALDCSVDLPGFVYENVLSRFARAARKSCDQFRITPCGGWLLFDETACPNQPNHSTNSRIN